MKLVQPDCQDKNVFNNFKRTLRDIDKLTNEQLALINFEVFHTARKRGAVEPE